MKTITAQDVANMKEKDPNVLIINVLSKEDFDQMHIPDSVNIPFEDEEIFLKEVEKKSPDKNKTIIVHCSSTECPASGNAAEILENAGYKNICRFEGGIKEWEDAGFEVQTKIRSQR